MKITIHDLKELVGESKPLETGVQLEENPSSRLNELEAIRSIVNTDYDNLTGVFGIKRVPVDVYFPSDSSKDRTSLGTPESNFTPLYNGELIALPIVLDTQSNGIGTALQFPPAGWDTMRSEWPRWRLDLWHEVLHQVEKDILGTWDGTKETHDDSYMDAIEYAVSKISKAKPITTEQLRKLTLGA